MACRSCYVLCYVSIQHHNANFVITSGTGGCPVPLSDDIVGIMTTLSVHCFSDIWSPKVHLESSSTWQLPVGLDHHMITKLASWQLCISVFEWCLYSKCVLKIVIMTNHNDKFHLYHNLIMSHHSYIWLICTFTLCCHSIHGNHCHNPQVITEWAKTVIT